MVKVHPGSAHSDLDIDLDALLSDIDSDSEVSDDKGAMRNFSLRIFFFFFGCYFPIVFVST